MTTMILAATIILIVPLVLLIIALVDILKSDFYGHDKWLWTFAVIFLPYAGFALYYYFGVQHKIQKEIKP